MQIIRSKADKVYLRCVYCHYQEIYHTNDIEAIKEYIEIYPFDICKKNNGKPHKMESVNNLWKDDGDKKNE